MWLFGAFFFTVLRQQIVLIEENDGKIKELMENNGLSQ